MIINDSASNTDVLSYLKNLWQSKNLLLVFAYRNVKSKIVQTRLGIFIVLIQAILLTLIFGIFISRFVTFNVNYPYLLFAVTGMMGWYIFSYVATFSGTSLLQNHQIASKIYFPRLIFPFSFGISVLIDFIGWFFILSTLLIYYHILPSVNLWAVFLFLIMDVITGLGIGLWILLLSLRNRDMILFAPLIIGIGMFLTPVFYPVRILPDILTGLLYFNPLAGVVEGFRWAIFNTAFDLRYLWGFFIIFLVFISGVIFFIRKDGNMADNL